MTQSIVSISTAPSLSSTPNSNDTPPPIPTALNALWRGPQATPLPLMPSNVNYIPTSSPLPVPRALTKKEIYKSIGQAICQVETDYGKATGICIRDNLIAVPYYILNIHRHTDLHNDSGYKIHPIRCVYQDVVYNANYATHCLDSAYLLNCAIFKIFDDDFPKQPVLPFFEGVIELGEDVYFGGFSLTQIAPTFHMGSVSSVIEDGLTYFTVDATVAPGNSGSPVFVIDQDILKLAGMIFHQTADFSPEDRETIAILNHLKKDPLSAMFHTLKINTPLGSVEKTVSDVEAIVMAINMIERHVTMGIGTAFHAKHLRSLDLREEMPLPSLNMPSFPYARDQALQIYKGRDDKDYYLHCDGREGKYLKHSRKKHSNSDFLRVTKEGAAMFNTYAAQNYTTLLQQAIKGWADAGANTEKPYFTFKIPIGADNGFETKSVEIQYGGKESGSHIRPKYLEA